MQTVLSYALRLLSKRMYTTREISQKLAVYMQKKEVTQMDRDNLLNETLRQLTAWGYLNDQQFAEQFIRSRLRMKPKSLRLLKYELQKKGIAPEAAQKAVSDAGVLDRDSAQKVLAMQHKKIERMPEEKRRAKVYRLLQTRGFTNTVIQDIMHTFFD